MQDEAKQALIFYGLDKLKEMTHGDMALLVGKVPSLAPPPDVTWAARYEAVLTGGQKREPDDLLTCIFTLVEPRGGSPASPHFYSAQHLTLDPQKNVLFPQPKGKATPASPALWEEFVHEFSQLPQLPQPDFETFYHLYHKYAWAVPCTYGEPGVSLFEQWKAMAALVFATGAQWADGPAANFTLIGGDIPGIQDFVYTITSKGAAKGLRGRSFFLQLLGDAVVRRLLADLGLCSCNVIYNAGGNFLLLGPGDVSEDKVESLSKKINRVLLAHFRGDLAFALAREAIPQEAIGASSPGENQWSTCEGRLKEAINRAKRQPFAELAAENRELVFGPEGEGGDRFCAICRCELAEGQGRPLREEEPTEPETRQQLICDDCHGFEELAQSLAQEDARLIVGTGSPGPASWQVILKELTATKAHPGFAYALTSAKPPADMLVYALSPDRFPAPGIHGFRWLANTTPREVVADDPQRTQIRPVNKMAEDATSAFQRVGILRMDMDNLGQLLATSIPQRSMALTSGLSAALDRFFIGWLDEMIKATMADPGMIGVEKGKQELCYVIYAGGDDLFVLGTWDRIPPLAQRIRWEFATYTGHPGLGISAGISVEGAKFPIYRAATRARDALEEGAKGRRNEQGKQVKDGITFLGETYGWDEFAEVQHTVEELVSLDKRGVPRRLLTLLRGIYGRWLSDLRSGRAMATRPYFGPWMWLQAYAIARLKGQYQSVRAELDTMQKDVVLGDKIGTLGLATRWAEYLTRGGGKS